ncbi:MAG TPA: glycosyltransferase family 39 protein [Kiritimatiellia bacterium]|nr:glycosyltransferase family 39 protein [Kiritimatiellia bacterium]
MNERLSQHGSFYERRAAQWLPFLAALAFSLFFCFVVYPYIASNHHAVLDPDGYGRLGFGLWKNGSLSFYPDTEPTVARGPAYPTFVGTLLIATGGWWPGSVQVAQCFLLALTGLLVFKMTEVLQNRRVAFWAAMAFAVYPIPIWYTSRIWVEIFAMFLMTGFCLTLMLYLAKPSVRVLLLSGLILGIATLCKSTFLPFFVIAPVLVASMEGWKRTALRALLIPLAASLVVVPWTARNWRVSGHIVPVHVLTGAALLDGDYIVDRFWETPFSYAPQCGKAAEVSREVAAQVPASLHGAERDYVFDAMLLKNRLRNYAAHPWILIRKMVANAGLFWTLGESPAKSLAIGLMLLPLAGLFAMAACHTAFRKDRDTTLIIPVALVFFYFAAHMPLNAVARYSIPLLPLMIVVVSTYMARKGPATSP